MIAVLFVIIVAAAVSMNPVEQTPPAPLPEPVPVVIEKTVVIECVPLGRNERLERDLTVPYEKRRYLNPKGDGCLRKSEASVVTSPPVPESQGSNMSTEEKQP